MTVRPSARHVASVLVNAMCVLSSTGQAQTNADTVARGPGADALRVGAGVVLAAAVAQVTNAPSAWSRTAGGAARRLADQSGFVALRSVSHSTLRRVVPWTASDTPCPAQVAMRAWCAVSQTLVVQNRAGALRPDVARIGSLAIASAGSVLWRPERASRGSATAFVLTRVGSGLLFAALRRGLSAPHRPQHE